MSSWAREIATGYAAGSAIGQDFRENSARRRVSKNLQRAQEMERQISQLAESDKEAAAQLEAQLGGFIGEAYSSAKRLDALTGDGSGGKYFNDTLEEYNPYRGSAEKPKNLLRRVADSAGATAPEATVAPTDPATAAVNADTPLMDRANVRPSASPMALSPEMEGIQNERKWRERAASLGKFSPYGQTGVTEGIAAQVVNEVYGQINGDMTAAVKRGKMAQNEAEKIASGIATMAMYVPQLKGATAYAAGDEGTGFTVYVDPDGEGGAEGYLISATGDKEKNIISLQEFEQGVRSYRNPSAILPNREKQEAEATARFQEQRGQLFTAVLESAKKIAGDLDPASQQALAGASTTAAAAGLKVAPMKAEDSAGLKDSYGAEFTTSVTFPNGKTYYVGRKTGTDKAGNPVVEDIYVDGATGKIVPNGGYQDAVAAVGAGEASNLTNAISLLASQRADRLSTAFDLFNMAAGMIGTTGVPTFRVAPTNATSDTAPTGIGLPQTKGERDADGFPVKNRGGNIGARNKNPLNLKSTSGEFRSFDDVETGFGAAKNQLLRYYEGKGVAGRPRRTITDIISLWAPPKNEKGGFENDTAKYISDVSQWMGVDPNEEIDLQDPNVMRSLLHAMAFKETGWRSPSGAPANSAQVATAVPPKPAAPAKPAAPTKPAAPERAPDVFDRAANAGRTAIDAIRDPVGFLSGGKITRAPTPNGASGSYADGGFILDPDYLEQVRLR